MAADVQRAVDSYTGAVDAALPGFVEGLYVTGSIPLGDYRSGTSDVDMVAVCAERPAGQQLEALSGLHRPSRPSVDLLYVTRQDLECDPSSLSLPNALEGVFKSDGGDVLAFRGGVAPRCRGAVEMADRRCPPTRRRVTRPVLSPGFDRLVDPARPDAADLPIGRPGSAAGAHVTLRPWRARRSAR